MNIHINSFIATMTDCPPGMVYQQCGPLCPQTCENNGIANCPYGCARGCFCPDGLVMHNGRCTEPLTCPGKIISSYIPLWLMQYTIM